MSDDAISHGFRPKQISWLTIALAILAVGTFLAISRSSGIRYAVPMGGGERVMENAGAGGGAVPPTNVSAPVMDSSNSGVSGEGKADGMYYPYPYPNYYSDVPATDTREFLKLNYDASLQTRDVQGLTRRVGTIVRGYDGRIDQESSSQKYGYVRFVVPMSKYEAFRGELEGLVGSRFLTVNISSQNLLPQKQSIEEQQKQADSALASYKATRQKIVTARANAIQSLQSQIDTDTELLAVLRAKVETSEIQAQMQEVQSRLALRKQQLANENASYSSQLKNADANIKNAEDWQTAVKTQDKALLDNVATVTGSVSLQWISYFAMVRLYLPGYWIPAILAMLAVLSLLNDRRRFGTV